MPKGFLPSRRRRADPRLHRRPRRTCRSRRWRACSGRSPRSSSRIRTSTARCRSSAPAARARRSTSAASSSRSSRARERPSADEVIQQLAARCSQRSRHQGVRAEHPGDPHRRPAHQEPVPVHAAGRRHDRALRVGAEGRGEAADAARASSTSPATCRSRKPQVDRRHRPQQGVRARRVGAGDREHALRRLRPAAGVDDLRADQPVLGGDGARAALPDRSVGAVAALRALEHRRAGAAQQRRDAHADDRPARDQPPRPAAGGDDLVRPEAGRVARRRRSTQINGPRPSCGCRRRSAACSRARRRRSRRRCAAWASCWCWRSS